MAFRNRVYGAGKLLILAGALVVTYIVFAVGSMRFALRAREVQVPDLTNQHDRRSQHPIIGALGLSLKVDDAKRAGSEDRRPDACSTQEPPPGSTARRQRTVRIWLSAGARVSTVPAVTGDSQRIAEAQLSQDGIAVGAISEIRSP